MNTLIKPGLFLSFILMMVSACANASGGIALGATRVIYPAEAKQTSLAITNSNKQERYLINAWIENANGQKEKTFAVTPPLFVSEPDSENTLRRASAACRSRIALLHEREGDPVGEQSENGKQ